MAGALFSRAKTWVAEILNYTDLNTEFDNILNNLYPEKIDDGSATETQMQTTTDPYPASVASLATSLQGEIQRLRYVIAQITSKTYWYEDPWIEGSATWDVGNLVDGAGETSAEITVTGAALGDYVFVSAPVDLQGITCTGYVSAANKAKIRVQNETGGTIDLASGTWKVRVMKAV